MASLSELFTNIANAIRAKTGSSDPIVATDFPTAISNIPKVIYGQVNSSKSTNLSIPIDFSTVSRIVIVPEYISTQSSYACMAFPETGVIECNLVEGDSMTVGFNIMGSSFGLSDVEIFHDGSALTLECRTSNRYFRYVYNYVIFGS